MAALLVVEFLPVLSRRSRCSYFKSLCHWRT